MQNFFYSKLIQIPQFITITMLKDRCLWVKGPLGSSFLHLPIDLYFEQIVGGYHLFGDFSKKNLILTFYKLFLNKIKGVYLGFFEILIINGVGWRVSMQNKTLSFSLGLSHPIEYVLKDHIEVILYDKQSFKIFGLELNIVQQTVADLCKLRLFNVYKGKGIYKQGAAFTLKESSKSKS